MDLLIRQLRTKYPDRGKEDREGSSAAAARGQQSAPLRTVSFKEGGQDKEGNGSTTRDQRLPPQKTQSFKGEKKRTQSWLRRQFSSQMSQEDYDSSIGAEYQIAVAAAAFAVKSLEETRIRDEKMPEIAGGLVPASRAELRVLDTSNGEEDTARVPKPRAKSIKVSETSEKKPQKAGGLIPTLKKKLSFADAIASSPPKTSPSENSLPEEKTIGPLLPSIKKAPTSADKSLDRTPSRKPESTEPKPYFPPHMQPQFQPVDSTRQSPTKLGMDDNSAEAWEKTELSRIKEKYEKLSTTILDWEDKKKKKAKHKLQRIEAELDKKRAKALRHYHTELARIDGIAGGARSQAIENRRNEEFKVKEKANKIRLTGKVPATCLCC